MYALLSSVAEDCTQDDLKKSIDSAFRDLAELEKANIPMEQEEEEEEEQMGMQTEGLLFTCCGCYGFKMS